MGTNYYLKNSRGEITFPSGETVYKTWLHIGKSSGGWCFSLRVHPDLGIRDLDDWILILTDPFNRIENEYGDVIAGEEMLRTITERKWGDDSKWKEPLKAVAYHHSWEEFFRSNHAEPGPNGLLRHRVEEPPDSVERSSFRNGCIKQGSGTWDCIVGDFS